MTQRPRPVEEAASLGPVIKAVSALRLAVADVQRSLAFYEKLGFTELPGDGGEASHRPKGERLNMR